MLEDSNNLLISQTLKMERKCDGLNVQSRAQKTYAAREKAMTQTVFNVALRFDHVERGREQRHTRADENGFSVSFDGFSRIDRGSSPVGK